MEGERWKENCYEERELHIMEQAEADLWHEGSYLESMTWHCMNYLLIRYRTSEATCISYGQFDTSLILCLAP